MRARDVLLTIWQLPQIALGRIVIACCKVESVEDYRDVMVYGVHRILSGVSLGNAIILRRKNKGYISPLDKAHEYGHCIQSRRWGWFYLPCVGLVSAFRNMTRLFRGGYYDGWPERQADILGGVKRTGSGIRYV